MWVLKNHLRRRNYRKVVGPAQDGRVQKQSMGLVFISANLHQLSTPGGSGIQLAAYSGGFVQPAFGNQNLHTRRTRTVLRKQRKVQCILFRRLYNPERSLHKYLVLRIWSHLGLRGVPDMILSAFHFKFEGKTMRSTGRVNIHWQNKTIHRQNEIHWQNNIHRPFLPVENL